MEAEKRIEAEAQDIFQTLRAEWDKLAERVQVSTRELQVQIEKQWADFQKSFHQKE